MASSTCRGFCEDAAESRKESGFPWKVCSKRGKSARNACASSFVVGLASTATDLSYRSPFRGPDERHAAPDPPSAEVERLEAVCASGVDQRFWRVRKGAELLAANPHHEVHEPERAASDDVAGRMREDEHAAGVVGRCSEQRLVVRVTAHDAV